VQKQAIAEGEIMMFNDEADESSCMLCTPLATLVGFKEEHQIHLYHVFIVTDGFSLLIIVLN
jgi:hypothetical protein